jgi:three-Cys-motif partner protein
MRLAHTSGVSCESVSGSVLRGHGRSSGAWGGATVTPVVFDEIGEWSQIKLEIIEKFAAAYSRIFGAERQRRFHHEYIDAFAGAGLHISKSTGQVVAGSPLRALDVVPPFKAYHFIDLDGDKAALLERLVRERGAMAQVYRGDCNEILLVRIFPTLRYEDYKRALCLLDPYGLHLKWQVMKTAGGLRTIDMILNFPVADINRNVLWRHPERVDPADIARMTAWWGDDSWRRIAYRREQTLFGDEEEVKEDTGVVVRAFQDRLRSVAGFTHVPDPLPMRNSQNAVVYYLFFASQNQAGARIINDIFKRYRRGRG